MVKSAKGSERLYQCLVNVESVNRIFEIAREHYSKSKSANSKIDLRKLFNLPKPWYIVLTEDNLLELSFPLYFVESLIEKFLGSESLKKFRKRCQEGLFLLHEKDGKTYISVYNFLRSSLIDNCESMGYSESRIKQITKFDDFLAKLFIEETEPNLNGSPLVLLTKYVRWMDAEDKEIQREKNFSHEEIKRRRLEVLEQIPEGKIDLCDFVDRLNSEGVSPKEEIFVNRLATLIRIRNDGAILGLMSLLHEKIKEGYSPQVWFLEQPRKAYAKLIKGESEPDWKISLDNIGRFPWLTFFRTPEFEVYIENGRIQITIFKPEKVTTSAEWKRIGSVYSRFRNIIGTRRRRWGVVSGKREILKQIHSFIREETRKIMNEDPSKGVLEALDFVGKQVEQKYKKSYKWDTLRRKLFTKIR